MSYATPADFISYFGESEARELTQLDNPMATGVDMVLLQKMLDHATAEINGYLAGGYTLPLPSVPQILVYHCCDVARWRCDKYRTREDVYERYKLVLQYLRDVAKGVVSLGLDNNNVEVNPPEMLPAYITEPPVFTRELLAGY